MPHPGTARRRLRVSAEILGVGAGTLVVAFLLKTFLVQAFFIPSASMSPQLAVGDRVLVSKLAFELHEPRRGDIVVLRRPDAPAQPDRSAFEWVGRQLRQLVGFAQDGEAELIKRVIALPGERVEARNGSVFIDGLRLEEPYLPSGLATQDFRATVVPPDHLWVMGDNRSGSSDSRTFGPVPTSDVDGRAFLKVWPLLDVAFL